MGTWAANPETGGITWGDEDSGLRWGDEPADRMADLVDAFVLNTGRVPTEAEIVAGLRFTLGGLDAS